MLNGSPVKSLDDYYKSELRAYLRNGNGIPTNDSSTTYIIVPVGQVDRASIIEIEYSGLVINSSGIARNLDYQISVARNSNNVAGAEVILTEQTTMANSASNSSKFNARYYGGLFDQGTFEARRTVPTAATNTQVTLSSLDSSANPLLPNNLVNKEVSFDNLRLAVRLNTSFISTITAIKVIVHNKIKIAG